MKYQLDFRQKGNNISDMIEITDKKLDLINELKKQIEYAWLEVKINGAIICCRTDDEEYITSIILKYNLIIVDKK